MKTFLLLIFLLFGSASFSKCPEVTASTVEQSLEDLYAHQNQTIIQRRLKETVDSFYFLRSYVPYFYTLLKACTLNDKKFTKLKSFQGMTVGDPHLMNFGSVLLNKKGTSVIMSLNDPDDGGKGYLYADVIRYLSSIYIFFENLNNTKYDSVGNKILKSYRLGLQGINKTFSKTTLKLLKKAKGQASPSSKWINIKSKKFSKRKDFNYDLKLQTQTKLAVLIKNLYNAKLVDSYGLLKYTGGSGALNRFETLIELSDKSLQWIEFKAIAPKPGMFPMAISKLPTLKNRYVQNITFQQSLEANALFNIVKIEGAYYLVRYRWSGNSGYELEADQKEELKAHMKRIKKIAKDQAYVLGRLHRKTLGATESNQFGVLLEDDATKKVIHTSVIQISNLLINAFQKTR